MKPFAYERAADTAGAIRSMAAARNAKFLAGGTNLVDLMRENIEQPDALIDVSRLPLTRLASDGNGGLVLGALLTNTAVANDAQILARYPLVAQAILCGASAQIRNMATIGGNLMQRTRCAYFYDLAARCNKRQPGAGCDALEGFNREHAILGASASCIATQPSDLCVALAALDATVQVEGAGGKRSIPFTEFHRLPGDTPEIETELRPDELITAVILPELAFAHHSEYRKVRDRASYAFALVSVAAALDVEDGVVKGVRIALGGVAHKPWRARRAEQLLAGERATEQSFAAAADAELAQAQGRQHNTFKIELAKRTLVDVLRDLAGGARDRRVVGGAA
jgi:xanthine dehydrogenase YagS FAD-binding subunit